MTTAERKALLDTALDRVLTELAEGDIKPNYNINGQSVDWPGYRQHLTDEAERLQNLIEMLGDDEGGIVEEVTQYTT